ncbi:hypothetical protein ACHQM5_016792 [Ranunculus cassubicifolius]
MASKASIVFTLLLVAAALTASAFPAEKVTETSGDGELGAELLRCRPFALCRYGCCPPYYRRGFYYCCRYSGARGGRCCTASAPNALVQAMLQT